MNQDKQNATPTRTVSAVQRLGPTHARGLRYLVGINSNIRQGEPINNMQLDFDLNCGPVPLNIGGRNFQMGLRTCFISLLHQNCEVHPGSQYKRWLVPGAFKAVEVQKTTSGHSREGGVNVEVDLDPVRFIAAIIAKLRFGASRRHEKKSETETEQSARIGLVVPSGQDRWRIGDFILGDARQQHGLLDGVYVGEEQSEDKNPIPLCRLEWVDTTAPMRVAITVSASFDSLLVFMSDRKLSEDENVLREAKKIVKGRSRRASSDHEDALRALVAGLVAAKAIRNAQKKAGAHVLENEFIIAQQTLLASLDEIPSPEMALSK